MAKFLLAIFLIVVGCKLVAEMPAFCKSAVAKQALCSEEHKETEKEKEERKTSESDTKYSFHAYYRWHLPEPQSLTLTSGSFQNFKLSSGYTNPAFTPPDFI